MLRSAYGVVLVVALAAQVNGATIVPSYTDLWDVSQGSVVTSHSGVLDWSGSDIRNMFGYETPDAIDSPENTIFADAETGSIHFVEWRLPSVITLRSIVLCAAHDGVYQGVERDATARGFSRFTLFAEGPTGAFDTKVFELFPSNPYETTEAPAYAVIESPTYNRLLIAANVAAVTSQRFRAEFVQYGSYPGAKGPRIRELDGFDTFYPDIAAPVPEPTSLVLWSGLGVMGLIAARRRTRGTPESDG